MTAKLVSIVVDAQNLSWLLWRAAGECARRGDPDSERVLQLAARVAEGISGRLEEIEQEETRR